MTNIEVEVMTVAGFEAWAAKNSPRYAVVYCVTDTTIAVSGLTYDEAWTARNLHSQTGKTAWVEIETENRVANKTPKHSEMKSNLTSAIAAIGARTYGNPES